MVSNKFSTGPIANTTASSKARQKFLYQLLISMQKETEPLRQRCLYSGSTKKILLTKDTGIIR
ncbi:MAG: hypothetical protein DI535_22995 [Citrobacter freundii]|nr:MAG: hypothetical protein DI535_22995 [Citrobacter freundii]